MNMNTREKLRERAKVFGTMISHFSWTGIIPSLKKRDIDFIIIELEHNFFDWRDIEALLRICDMVGLTALVRVTEIAYHQISKVLDLGASGILIPRIESIAQLEQVIDMVRLPPRGRKGVGGYDFAVQDLNNKLAAYNTEKMILVQVENPIAISQLELMLETKEVAGVIVGPYDLSVSLQIPGQFHNPRFKEAVIEVVRICDKHAVSCGMFMGGREDIQYWRGQGMNIIWSGSDYGFFMSGYNKLCDVIDSIE